MSLRRSIMMWMAGLIAAVGAISAIVTYVYTNSEAQSTFDTQIRQIAEVLSSETYAAGEQSVAAKADNLFLIQIWDANGNLIRSSGDAKSSAKPGKQGYSDETLEGATWHSYTLVSAGKTVRVSVPMDERNEQGSNAALQIAIPMAVVIPLSWLVLHFIIGRILSRLEQVSSQLRSRKVDDPTPISKDGLPHEITPIVDSFNGLVSRMRETLQLQKRFLSDAAHELRTPLTAFSIQLDNVRSVLTTKEQKSRLSTAQAGSKRANQLVNQLLQLARAEGTATANQPTETAEIAKIMNETISTVSPIAKAKGIAMVSRLNGASASVPAHDFRQVLEVALENAVQYSPEKSTVELKSTVSDNRFEIEIIDIGPGIDPKSLPHVFDRFYRAAPQLAPGTGLGLAIAKAICDGRGWTISLANRNSGNGAITKISGSV